MPSIYFCLYFSHYCPIQLLSCFPLFPFLAKVFIISVFFPFISFPYFLSISYPASSSLLFIPTHIYPNWFSAFVQTLLSLSLTFSLSLELCFLFRFFFYPFLSHLLSFYTFFLSTFFFPHSPWLKFSHLLFLTPFSTFSFCHLLFVSFTSYFYITSLPTLLCFPVFLFKTPHSFTPLSTYTYIYICTYICMYALLRSSSFTYLPFFCFVSFPFF